MAALPRSPPRETQRRGAHSNRKQIETKVSSRTFRDTMLPHTALAKIALARAILLRVRTVNRRATNARRINRFRLRGEAAASVREAIANRPQFHPWATGCTTPAKRQVPSKGLKVPEAISTASDTMRVKLTHRRRGRQSGSVTVVPPLPLLRGTAKQECQPSESLRKNPRP